MSAGPLDDERLRAVETCLNEARFDDAQKHLAELGKVRGLGPGVAYLTARLLFERGRIDHAALLQRLQDLLADWPDFEAARTLLESHGGVPPEAPTLRASLGVRMSLPAAHSAPVSRRPTDPAPPPPSSAASTPPLRLETPRIPSGAISDPRYLGTATTQPASKHAAPVVQERPAPSRPGPVIRAVTPEEQRAATLQDRPAVLQERLVIPAHSAATWPEFPVTIGTPGSTVPLELDLEPPRSEMPTEPAPPPSGQESPESLTFEPEEPRAFSRAVWDPLEMDLVHQRAEAAFLGLEKLANVRLDKLLSSELPKLPDVAGEAADFLSTAPVTSHFAPFDMSLDSIERLDQALSLFASAQNRGSPYALTVLLTAYIGECVRGAAGGQWQGRLVEPEEARVERRSGEVYVPWARVQRALALGTPLRPDAGPRPHPAAEPPDRPSRPVGEPWTPWTPAQWPDLALVGEIGRALPNSVVGAWAARVAKQPLDRSPASVPTIDRYLALLMTPPEPGGQGAWARRPAVLTGAYIGEMLCLHAAGRWSENDMAPMGPLRYEVLMPDGTAAYPVLWTFDRLRTRGRQTLVERVRAVLGR